MVRVSKAILHQKIKTVTFDIKKEAISGMILKNIDLKNLSSINKESTD
jgi:hypothetical protein